MCMKSSADLISDVCKTTQNPSLCEQTLRSDPHAAGADLKGLGFISIGISQTNAKQTSGIIASLQKQATDPKLKERLGTCAETNSDAIDNLNEANQALKNNDIATFRTRASAALDGPVTCDDSFEGPPAEPSQLQQANKKLEGLISTVLAVGAKLGGS
ncbi:Pectinesterase [Bertholletia excelsa]